MIANLTPNEDEPRVGYVNYHTPTQPEQDSTVGTWRFRLASTVTDFRSAWRAAVHEFATSPEMIGYAREVGHPLNYGDLIDLGDVILARHGLTLDCAPPGDSVTVDHDAVLIEPDSYEDR